MQVNGDITYNGKKFDEFVVARSAGYIEQTDQHYAALTVRETFNFAASCQGAGYHSGPCSLCCQVLLVIQVMDFTLISLPAVCQSAAVLVLMESTPAQIIPSADTACDLVVVSM